MKRRRRPTARPLLRLEARLFGGEVIPPRSIVIARGEHVRTFGNLPLRIGYYSPADGLDCVWLVTPNAEYQQTVDQRFVRRNFTVMERSRESDFYGLTGTPLKPLASLL